MSQEEQKRKQQINRIGRYSVLGVFVLWIATYFIVYHSGNFAIKNAAELGDSFGGLNTLFSGLAFAGLIYTILLQQEELHLQRKELQETKEEIKKSAEAQAEQADNQIVAAKLQALNTMLDVYNRKRELLIVRKTEFLKEQQKDSLNSYRELLKDKLGDDYRESKNIDVSSEIIENQEMIDRTEAEIELILANLYVEGSLENKFFKVYFEQEKEITNVVDMDETQFRTSFGVTKLKFKELSMQMETDSIFFERYTDFREQEEYNLKLIERKKLMQSELGREQLILEFSHLNSIEDIKKLDTDNLVAIGFSIGTKLIETNTIREFLLDAVVNEVSKDIDESIKQNTLRKMMLNFITSYIKGGELPLQRLLEAWHKN